VKYIKQRQNPISHVPQETMDKLFGLLVDKYSETWLRTKGYHPVRALWDRKDWLSTTELFLLAASIRNLDKIDTKWTEDQIAISKMANENTRKGAFFELISLEGIFNSTQSNSKLLSIEPARKNQQGHDGLIRFRDGSHVVLSIKNYNLSAHHKAFLGRCKEFEGFIENLMKELKIFNIQVMIDSLAGYPTTKQWKILEERIPGILALFDGTSRSYTINDDWVVFTKRIEDEQEFRPEYVSYIIIIISPYHKNEHDNLYSKFQSACSNLVQAKICESEDNINCILMHIPDTVSVDKCIEWTNIYYKDFPNDPISGVVFYQPTVVSDVEANTSHVHHCVAYAVRERFDAFSGKHGDITMQFPVGTHGSKSSNLQFTNEKGENLIVNDRYIFQSGELFYRMLRDSSGYLYGTMKNRGSGIRYHLVVGEDVNSFTLQGIIPPSHDLLIL